MDVGLLIRERLAELGRGQRELAVAAEVTESYISQLLTRRKSPPASNRTDIYEKMETFLNLPPGRLSELADRQRVEEYTKNLGNSPAPRNAGVREFVLFKCRTPGERQIRAEFEQHAFGLVERLATQTLMDVAKDTAREALHDEKGVQAIANASGRSYEGTRVTILEFLDTDVFNLTAEHCEAYLDPMIESWSIDVTNLRIDVVLNHELSHRHWRRFAFVETGPVDEEPGFRDFLRNRSLSGDATDEEIDFLKSLRFDTARPTAYYYYHELQSLRDPLHFQKRDEDRHPDEDDRE